MKIKNKKCQNVFKIIKYKIQVRKQKMIQVLKSNFIQP